MQESMQGRVNKDIFNNNSYHCKVQTSKRTSKMTLSFQRGNFKFSHLGKDKKVETFWYGSYKLVKAGVVLFRTKEFRMTDDYGDQIKKDGELVFKVKGNASLFHLSHEDVKYSCARSRS